MLELYLIALVKALISNRDRKAKDRNLYYDNSWSRYRRVSSMYHNIGNTLLFNTNM